MWESSCFRVSMSKLTSSSSVNLVFVSVEENEGNRLVRSCYGGLRN